MKKKMTKSANFNTFWAQIIKKNGILLHFFTSFGCFLSKRNPRAGRFVNKRRKNSLHRFHRILIRSISSTLREPSGIHTGFTSFTLDYCETCESW